MRFAQVLGVVVISVCSVLVTDLALDTSLRRAVHPLIVSPANDAIETPPVRVAWEGSRSLVVNLIHGGRRARLGNLESPLEINASYFPQPGQYVIEVRSPTFGRWITAERRFRVRPAARPPQPPTPSDKPEPEPPEDLTDSIEALTETLAGLQDAYERASAERTALAQENANLRKRTSALAEAIQQSIEARHDLGTRLADAEAQGEDLLAREQSVMDENASLRARLRQVPACTTWGYVSYPRAHTVPPRRRVILASNGRGEIFSDFTHCELTRRSDPTAASRCACIGSP